MKRWLLFLSVVCWSIFALAADEPVALPALSARVTDLTGTLSAEQRQGLEARLAEFEARKGAQIVVLLLPTTQPEAIEQFGIRLAEAWRAGRKQIDDGVIVILAKEDRRVRIEVGYGLEGALNDATARRIIAERMTPRFAQGDYFGGLSSGIEAIAAVVEGEPLAPVAGQRGNEQPAGGDSWLVWAFAIVILASVARRLFGLLGAVGAAGLAGFLALTAFGLLAALAAGLVVFLLSFVPPGVFLSAGRFGGGRGGGGFSGGGGGFGGGGASGRW